MTRALLLTFLIASSGWAQLIRWSGATGDVTSSTGGTITIQQPASGAKLVSLETVTIYCANACTITQAQNGTGATATAGTLNSITNTSGTVKTTFFTASNVSGGTSIGPNPIHNPAGQTTVLNLNKVSLPATSSININYSITVTQTSGTWNATIIGSEK